METGGSVSCFKPCLSGYLRFGGWASAAHALTRAASLHGRVVRGERLGAYSEWGATDSPVQAWVRA